MRQTISGCPQDQRLGLFLRQRLDGVPLDPIPMLGAFHNLPEHTAGPFKPRFFLRLHQVFPSQIFSSLLVDPASAAALHYGISKPINNPSSADTTPTCHVFVNSLIYLPHLVFGRPFQNPVHPSTNRSPVSSPWMVTTLVEYIQRTLMTIPQVVG